jgi:hypothetical protein
MQSIRRAGHCVDWRDDPLTLCIYNQGWCTTPCIARPGESSTTDLLLARLGEQIEVWRPDPRASVRMLHSVGSQSS